MWRWFTQNFFNYPVQPEYHYESLINAIKDNDKKRIEELLGFPGIISNNSTKNSKLILAVIKKDDSATLKKILRLREINAFILENGKEILLESIGWRKLEIVKLLKKEPAILQQIIKDERNTILLEAIEWGHLDIVNEILTISQVKARAAMEENKALREAAKSGYLPIVKRLLKISQVLAQITANNNGAFKGALFNGHTAVAAYLSEFAAVRNYVEKGFTLQEIANNDEGAVFELTTKQSTALLEVKKEYAQRFEELGRETILKEIEEYLAFEYEKSPIVASGISLPLIYNPNLTPAQKALYYSHPIHTAYRYLFCHPNPWISEHAKFVFIHTNGSKSATVPSADKENIAYIWLAIQEIQNLSKENSKDSLKRAFVGILSDLGRAYNWKNRGENNATDDNEGDKPSCNLGIIQPFIQFLTMLLEDFPNLKPLTPDIIKNYFKEKLIACNQTRSSLFDLLESFSLEKLEKIENALMALTLEGNEKDISSQHRQILTQIAINSSMQTSFIKDCEAFFSFQRLAKKTSFSWATVNFDNYYDFINYLCQNTSFLFCEEIFKKISDLKNKKYSPIASTSSGTTTLMYSYDTRKRKHSFEKKRSLSPEKKLLRVSRR